MQPGKNRLLTALVGLVCTAAAPAQETRNAERTAGYHDHARLGQELRALVERAGPRATLDVLARTSAGREVWLLSLADTGPRPPEDRQAVLLVGGVSGNDPTGSAVCLGLARQLVDALGDEDHDLHDLLASRQVYVVPRLNPDGCERFFGDVWHAQPHNARATDHDRDGVVNEDGVNDLDGDGIISVMRIPDPHGTWLADPDHPRLMKPADPVEGLRGTHRLELEGLDDDADGHRNEDGAGGVDLDRNWPHFFAPGNSQHGQYQLSEPENRGLATFVADHPQITLALLYGLHDNLIDVPKGKTRGPDGQSYRDLHPDDVARYQHIAKAFKEQTGLTGSDGSNPEGALFAWLYSQRAITTFAIRPWWPLDRKPEPASQPTTQPDASPDTETAEDGDDAKPKPEKDGGKRDRKKTDENKPSDDPLGRRVTGSKWLAWADASGRPDAFRTWTAFEHPSLGAVELGGFAPFVQTAAPAAELPDLVTAQATFLAHASALLPAVEARPPVTDELGADLWRVELTLVNTGYLPTHTAIAGHTRQPALVVRPELPAERIVGGQRAQRIDRLAGSGGAADVQWLIRGKAGDTFSLNVYQRALGSIKVPVRLSAGNGGTP